MRAALCASDYVERLSAYVYMPLYCRLLLIAYAPHDLPLLTLAALPPRCLMSLYYACFFLRRA